jgi:hypothetical protein
MRIAEWLLFAHSRPNGSDNWLRSHQLEEAAGAGIPSRAMHAGDEVKTECVDVALVGIDDECVVHVPAQYLPDDGELPGTGLLVQNRTTFKGYRTPDYSWGHDLARGKRFQPCEDEFIDISRGIHASLVHRCRHLVRYQMDDKFSSLKDVLCRIFRPLSWMT